MSNLPELARHIASAAHEGQYRRDGSTPYIEHPRAVARRVAGDERAEAVAWLHDVLEDTAETSQSLAEKGIPDDVIASVEALTKTDGIEYELYLDGILADPLARRVKIADMLTNLSDQPTSKQIRKYATGLLKLVDE